MNTREGGVNAPCGCSKGAECGYPKSQDEMKYLTQYLKISLDIVLDVKTFDVSGKSDFWDSEKAENPWYVWVFSLFYVPLKSVIFF